MSEPSKDEAASADSSDIPTNIVEEELELARYTENQNTDLQESVMKDPNNSHDISTESPKESNLSNLTSENASVMDQYTTKLQIRRMSDELQQKHAIYISLMDRNKDRFQFASSESENKSQSSDEPQQRSKSFIEDKEPKSKWHKRSKSYQLRLTLKSSETDKKTKPSKLSKQKNPVDLISELLKYLQDMDLNETKIDKGYSCETPATLDKSGNIQYDTKDKVQRYFNMLKRSEVVSSPAESSSSGTLTPGSGDSESKSNPDPPISLEDSSSISTKSDLSDVSTGPKHAEMHNQSKTFQQSSTLSKPEPSTGSDTLEQCPRSNLTEPCMKFKLSKFPENMSFLYEFESSKVINPSEKLKPLDPDVSPSGRPEQLDPSVRPKQLDPSVRPKQLDPSLEEILSSLLGNSSPKQSETEFAEPSNETEEDRLAFECKLKDFLLVQRSRIMFIRENAERVKSLMESISLLRKDEQSNQEIIHVQYSQNATDWFKLLYYWDVIKAEFNIMIGNITIIYDALLEKSMLPTRKQFYDFIEHLERVCFKVEELHKICSDGLPRCTRYCSALDRTKFFDYATSFTAVLGFLLRYLDDEVREIKKFKEKTK